MRIGNKVATASLGCLITLGMSARVIAATPSKIDDLVAKVKIFTPVPEAESTAKEILKLDPTSGDANSMLEWNRYREHKLDDAIALGKKAIGLKFKDVFWMRRANNCLYHCYIDKKDWQQSLKYALLCYKVERNSGVAHDLSILYEKTGNTKLSKEYADTAEKLAYEQRRENHHGIANIREATDPKTVDTILDRVNEGLAKNPKDLDARLLRAQCYKTKKLYAKALKDFDAAIALAPHRGLLYYQRARVYKLLGDDKKSAANILEAKKHGFDLDKIRQQVKELPKGTNSDGRNAPGTAGSGNPTLDGEL